MTEYQSTGAVFSNCGLYRHRLWRMWDVRLPSLAFVGMNPSKANALDNDATVTRLEKRARMHNFGSILVVNLEDFIETDSTKLKDVPDHVRSSRDNHAHLMDVVGHGATGASMVFCGWGIHGHRTMMASWFNTMARDFDVPLFCLRKNDDGSPEHPLYIPYEQPFQWFGGAVSRH